MKKILIAVVLCLVLVGLMVSPALAAAQKVPFYPVSGGSSDNVLITSPSQGTAVINNPKGNTTLIIEGNVDGLAANHFYTVWVRNLTGYTGPSFNSYSRLGYYLLDTFTTNNVGIGNFHLNVLAKNLPAGRYELQVAINDSPDVNIIGSTVLATEKYTEVIVGK